MSWTVPFVKDPTLGLSILCTRGGLEHLADAQMILHVNRQRKAACGKTARARLIERTEAGESSPTSSDSTAMKWGNARGAKVLCCWHS